MVVSLCMKKVNRHCIVETKCINHKDWLILNLSSFGMKQAAKQAFTPAENMVKAHLNLAADHRQGQLAQFK